MNKILLGVNVVWMSALAALSFKSCKMDSEGNDQNVILNYANEKFDNITYDYAKILAKNYASNHHAIISKNLNINDAKSTWYSLDQLKNFVWQIEYHSLQLGQDINAKDLGVRIYYGQNPEEKLMEGMKENEVNPKHSKLHTLFFVPTINKAGKNEDFDPRVNFADKSKLGADYKFHLLKDKKHIFQLTQRDNNTTIMNHGGLCPPCQ